MSAPYRITRPSISATAGAAGAPPSEPGADLQGYLDRLMKMIPGEYVNTLCETKQGVAS